VDHAGALLGVELDEALTAGLKALARRHGTTLYMTLVAGWAVVLSRLSGQDDVVVGTPTAGRGRREIEGLIGCFVNTLALRLELSGAPTVAELLGRVKERALAAQHHQDIPFEQVVELVDPVRSLSHHPLFQVVIAWQNLARGDGNTLWLPGLEAGAAVESSHVDAKVDLWLGLWEADDRILGSVKYATALFDRATVERHLAYLRRVLEAFVADDLQAVDALPLLPEAERRLVLEEWNRTEAEYPRGLCIHELFEAQVGARRTPWRCIFGDERLTYAELNARANRLARRLVALGGVGPEVRGAGAGAVGGDGGRAARRQQGRRRLPPGRPRLPAERRRWMLERPPRPSSSPPRARRRSGPVTRRARPSSRWTGRGGGRGRGRRRSFGRRGCRRTPAYVIFTSGSTGRPKGVLVPHRGIGNLAAAQREAFGVEPGRPRAAVRLLLLRRGRGRGGARAAQRRRAGDGAARGAGRPRAAGAAARQAVTVATFRPRSWPRSRRTELPALRTIVSAGEAVPRTWWRAGARGGAS
jgi:non-ribosomal peptide synthetase component F